MYFGFHIKSCAPSTGLSIIQKHHILIKSEVRFQKHNTGKMNLYRVIITILNFLYLVLSSVPDAQVFQNCDILKRKLSVYKKRTREVIVVGLRFPNSFGDSLTLEFENAG